MFKLLSLAAALALSSGVFAQTTQPGQTTPSVTPSDTPAVTPSQTPAVTPSQPPAVTPSQTPSVTQTSRPPMIGESAVGGMSRCENMIGMEKDRCLQEERAAAASGARPAGAGSGSAPAAPAGPVR